MSHTERVDGSRRNDDWLLLSAMALSLVACGTELHSAREAFTRPPRIERPVPPINLRIDVRIPTRERLPAPIAPARADATNRYREWALDDLIPAMRTRSVRHFLGSYRSTSPIYRLELEGGLEVGFKPAIRGQETWWHHDVVAYRLARILGLGERVPPAIARRVSADSLGDVVQSDGLITAPDDNGMVPGVAIFWLPVLRTTFLDSPRHRGTWQPWMEASGPMPTGRDATLAAEIASVLVFDYLEANEDRWNDANIRADENDHLVFRDNNVGWFTTKMEDLTWGRTNLYGTQRFPRALIAALERATPDALAAEIARANAGIPLIDARTLRAYGARRDVVLEYVRTLRARFGDERVLVWP